MGRHLEQTLAVLNGLVGDYLERTHNGLATDMTLRRDGAALAVERKALAGALKTATSRGRLLVLVHGLMSTEEVWRMPDGSDYGSLLERDRGFTALYVRYNTGLPIANNGERLAALLERLVTHYPVDLEELMLIGHSMGGLVIRSASHVASLQQHAWLGHVRRCIYIGTPHLGAPGERVGKVVSEVLHRIPNAYTKLIANVADLRSAGVKDLGHADLRYEDRALTRSPWALVDARHPLPLLPGIEHHVIAGALFARAPLATLLGDFIVPVTSATFEQPHAGPIPPERIHVLADLNHLALAHHPAVYAIVRGICEDHS